ncbi:fasciclin domain-containing protein [Sphingobacterium bambusae]|uniref:Fasciclin domain-containing protein n=1 Tax=Sphingobacterium bambusae TaxID=662858 RepID=A0ABW6BFE8_9SPHI|nr:fasciclin domain-containing protein [Sphingobacterium bambusae]WPL46924.1 fasciclin domain-containing protein [Sphingobacterium bambusae]
MKCFVSICCLVLVGIVFFSACQKEYYDESGTHDAHFGGSIWEYLETRPELFDTLQVALQIAGLDQVLQREHVTFFAPTDQCVLKSVWALNAYLYESGQDTITSLRQVDPSVWRKFFSRYILKGTYLAKDFPQLDTLNLSAFPGQGYVTYENDDMNIGVLYNDAVTKNSDGTDQVIKYAGYRQLYLNYPFSRGNNTGVSYIPFITAPVATSDIQPANGALHVLQFSKHAFGFLSYLFVQEALAKGITTN